MPFWETNGEYGKLPLAPPGKKADIHGSGFNPWQFPEIHDKL